MPRATYYKTSQEWFDKSLLLIEAHPTTVCPSLSAPF